VEGIGYDFIPNVLDQKTVDTWIKTSDKSSFLFSRRLIREEGLLCGGSSGSAISALMEALLHKNPELNHEDKTVVVVLPDSVRNYLTKFVDDTWMENNDFIPTSEIEQARQTTQWHGANISDLNLKPVVTVRASDSAEKAMDLMREKSFDQLPVLGDKSGRLVGMVTLGNLLSYISRGRATGKTLVKEVMFDFLKMKEVVTDASEIGSVKTTVVPETKKPAAEDDGGGNAAGTGAKKTRKRRFEEVTLQTPLSALSRFFEHNSAAVVTQRDDEHEGLKVLHVVTKVDLLGYLVRIGKRNGVAV